MIRFPVIQHARQFVNLLMQAAAERHVHFLKAPADAEHWNACRNGRTQ